MGAVTTMPLTGEWTTDDVDALPDDGLRYELVDGVLLVSPSPTFGHQVGVAGLLQLLVVAATPGLRVLPAPLDVRFTPTRQLQPDIVVVPRREDYGTRADELPVLVVEVLSPSSRATDLTLKRHVFEQAGVPSYWLFDTEAPSLTVLELQHGAYTEVGRAEGAQVLIVTEPFVVSVVPAEVMR